MAGSNAAFNPELFRSQIRSAMIMGSPTKTAEKATFFFRVTETFTRQDSSSRPYSWTAPVVSTDERDPVQVDCAVEFGRSNSETTGNTVGSFDNTRATITLLDEDFELVEGASHVTLGGNFYVIDYIAPPIGLFDVTVYQMYCRAAGEE